MRFQDENTTPREPTLAERKAREQAEKRRAEEERLAEAEDARKTKVRKRVMVGAGVTVGLAAVVGIGYLISTGDDETARCTDEDGVVVDDANCVTPVAGTSGNYSGGHYGGYGYPVFIGGGGRQYHYTYGGSGELGQRVSGGTTVVPKSSTKVKTYTSGRTISGGSKSGSSSGGSSASRSGSSSGSDNGTVSRGGLGSSSGSKSSGS
jgi:hypothetical protein